MVLNPALIKIFASGMSLFAFYLALGFIVEKTNIALPEDFREEFRRCRDLSLSPWMLPILIMVAVVSMKLL